MTVILWPLRPVARGNRERKIELAKLKWKCGRGRTHYGRHGPRKPRYKEHR